MPKLSANDRKRGSSGPAPATLQLDVDRAAQRRDGMQHDREAFDGIQARDRAELDRLRADTACPLACGGQQARPQRVAAYAHVAAITPQELQHARGRRRVRDRERHALEILASLGVAPGIPRGAVLPVNATPRADRVDGEPRLRGAIPDHEHVGARGRELAAAMPRAQRGRPRRHAGGRNAVSLESRCASSPAMRSATNGCMSPAAFSQPCANVGCTNARVAHELAEMRLDAGGLLEAHEVRDYGHAEALLIGVLARHVPARGGGPCRTRTYNQWIKSPLLYQLS